MRVVISRRIGYRGVEIGTGAVSCICARAWRQWGGRQRCCAEFVVRPGGTPEPRFSCSVGFPVVDELALIEGAAHPWERDVSKDYARGYCTVCEEIFALVSDRGRRPVDNCTWMQDSLLQLNGSGEGVQASDRTSSECLSVVYWKLSQLDITVDPASRMSTASVEP
jgi:hypothetical protein